MSNLASEQTDGRTLVAPILKRSLMLAQLGRWHDSELEALRVRFGVRDLRGNACGRTCRLISSCDVQALTLESNNAEAHYRAGIALLKQKEVMRAKSHFKLGLLAAPTHAKLQKYVKLFEQKSFHDVPMVNCLHFFIPQFAVLYTAPLFLRLSSCVA